VRLEVKTPFGNVVVSRDPSPSALPRQLDATIRDAFAAALRQLDDESRRRRCA
jgi:hypothetical protein